MAAGAAGKDSRLVGADAVRAAACLLVLGQHLFQRLNPGTVPAYLHPVLYFIAAGTFGVAAFFVLSGYLLSRPFWIALDRGERMPSIRIYALRRVARILPGYWLALTVTFVVSFTLFPVPLDRLLTARYVGGLLFINEWHWKSAFPVEINGPLWSIGFEVASYVFLPVCLALLFLFNRRRPAQWGTRVAWLAAIAAFVAAQALIVAYLPVDRSPGRYFSMMDVARSTTPQFNPIGFFAMFALGGLAASVQVRLASIRSAVFDLLCVVGLGLAAYAMMLHRTEMGAYALASIPYQFPWFAIGVAVVLVALPSSLWLGRLADNSVAVFIARISFGIYVWHFLILELIHQFFEPAFGYSPRMQSVPLWLLWSGIGVVISFAIATASFYWLEQPVIRLARRLEVNAREARLPRGHDHADIRATPAAGS